MNSNNNSSKTYNGLIPLEEWESYLSTLRSTEITSSAPVIVLPHEITKGTPISVQIVSIGQPTIITSCSTQVLAPTKIVGNGQPITIIVGKPQQVNKTLLLGGKENQIVAPQITTSLDNFVITQDVQDWKREHDWESELNEWKSEMKSDIRPDELKAILKFLKLSPQSSIEDLIKFMSSNMLDSDATDKVWENVSTSEEYVQTMLMFLEGKLFSTPSHGAPLLGESFLILSELYELTRLGCPTFNSSPFMEYERNGETCKSVPWVEFLCPNKIVYQIAKILIGTCHITMVAEDKCTIHMISPSQKDGNRAWSSTYNRSSEMENVRSKCHPSCGEAMFNTYTDMFIVSIGFSNKFFTDVIAAVKSAQAQG